jgi:hypothetical protein
MTKSRAEQMAREYCQSLKIDEDINFSLTDIYLSGDGERVTAKSLILAGMKALLAEAEKMAFPFGIGKYVDIEDLRKIMRQDG